MGYDIRVGPGGVANTQDIYSYLTGPKELGGYGFSTSSALGLMSNMQRESGFITNVTEYGGGPGIGLFQYTYSPRKAEFIAAVPDWQTNAKAQIDFALTGETTLGKGGVPNSQLLQNIMNSNGDINTIQSQILSEWEIPADLYGGAIKNMNFARQISGTVVGSDGKPLNSDPNILDQVGKAGTVSTSPVQGLSAQQRQELIKELTSVTKDLADDTIDLVTRDGLLEKKSKLEALLSGPASRTGSQSKTYGRGIIQDLKCNLPKAMGKNPLHDLKNYTYRLIISTLTKAEYNDFVSNKTGDLRGQNFPKPKSILISSGGEDLNKKNQYGVQDFYFQDLEVSTIMAATGAGAKESVSYSSDIDFTLIEPLGTTLFERLFYASTEGDIASTTNYKGEVAKNTKIPDSAKAALTSFVYLLTIEFKGYAPSNKTGASLADSLLTKTKSEIGNFQTKYHIPFIFSSIDTDISSSGTQYKCKAIPAAAQVFFTLNQAIPSTSTIKENQPLREALTELSSRYNDNQNNLPNQFKKNTYKFRVVDDKELPSDDTEIQTIARELREQTTFRGGPPVDASRITFMTPTSDQQKKDGRIPGGKTGTTPFRPNIDQAYHIGMGTTGIEVLHQMMMRTDFIQKQVELARSGKMKDGIWWYNIRGNVLFDEKEKSKNPHIDDGKIFEYIIEPYKIYVINDLEQSQLGTKTFRNYEYIFTGKNNDIIRWDLSYDGLLYTEMQRPEPSSTTAAMGQPATSASQAINAAGQQRGISQQTKISFPTLSNVDSKAYFQKKYRPTDFGIDEKNASSGRVVKYDELQSAAFMESLFRHQSSNQQWELDVDIIGDPEYLSSFNKLTHDRNKKIEPKSTDNKEQEKKNRADTKRKTSEEIAGRLDSQLLIGLRFLTPTDVDPITQSYKGIKAADLTGIYTLNSIKHMFKNGKFTQQIKLIGTDNKDCPTSNSTGTNLQPTAGGTGSPGQIGTRPLSPEDKNTLAAIDERLNSPDVSPEEARALLEARGALLNGGNATVAGNVINSDAVNPLHNGQWSSEYGTRHLFGVTRSHDGIDIIVPPGGDSTVYSSTSGTVIHSGNLGNYGNSVIVDAGDGYTILYAHLQPGQTVPVGTAVEINNALGVVGSTGNSTGPHLHYEVRYNGTAIDPRTYNGNLPPKK